MTDIIVGTTSAIEVTVEVPVIEITVDANVPGPPGPPGPPGSGGGATNLDALTDVDTTTTVPHVNDALVYNGTLWKPNASAGQDEVFVSTGAPPTAPFDGQVWFDLSGAGVPPGSGVITAHSDLTGLTVGDDHPQYFNAARADVRYAPVTHSHAHASLSGIDTDSALSAIHHTLGGGAFQAAPGNHTHAGGGASGTVITSGTAAPIATTGNVGEYYLDTDDNILYGPKVGTSWPVAVRGVPVGGASGQMLAKSSTSDFAVGWVTGAGGGGLQTRATASITTASLASGGDAVGTITLAPGFRVMKVTTSKAARVRLYQDTASQTADRLRTPGTDPENNHGLLLDVVTTSSLTAFFLSPLVDGFDAKATPDGVIPITIANLDASAAAITVSLLWLRTE